MNVRTQLKSGMACYTVQSGDNLSAIAQRFYGSASEYPKIYYSNQETIGPNENLLGVGQKLVIPD